MKILFLTNLLPYPLDNGGKIKTYTTISALFRAGHSIDLVCFTEKEEIWKNTEQVLKLCKRVEQVPQKLTTAENLSYMLCMAAKSLFSSYSFGLYKYQSKEMEIKLAELCKENTYDCVYYDHLQLCVYKKYLSKRLPMVKTILDEHNCEAIIMSRNADTTKNLIKIIFFRIESWKLRRFESKMLQSMNANIILSIEDYRELRKQSRHDFKYTIIPIGVQDRGIKMIENVKKTHLNILFLGTLTWEPNNQGVIWFLKKVIPLIESFDFTFYIVGKNPSSEIQELAKKYNNIIVTGYVDSVDEYYDKCDCMVAPLFIGSGQRVKLIESFSKGMPSISTKIGAEGLDIVENVNIILADTANEFKEAIKKMYDIDLRKNMSIAARKCYEKNYSPCAIEKKINALLEQMKCK